MSAEQEQPVQEKLDSPSRRRFLQLAVKLPVAAAGAAVLGRIADRFAPILPEKRQTSFFTPEYAHAIEGFEQALEDGKGNEYGRFFTQTGNKVDKGFVVMNTPDGKYRFWDAYKRFGGVDVLGYPISDITEIDGFVYLPCQGGILQVNPNEGSPDGIVLGNAAEILADIEKANPEFAAQLRQEGVPAHEEGSFSPEQRLTWIDDPLILQAYDKRGGSAINGFPTSHSVKVGPFEPQRYQRVILQLWLDRVPGGPTPGTVVSILSGDLLKRGGWIKDSEAVIPKTLDQILFGTPSPEPTPTPEQPFQKEYGDPAGYWKLENDWRIENGKAVRVDQVTYGLDVRDVQRLTEAFHDFPNHNLQIKFFDIPVDSLLQETVTEEFIGLDGKKHTSTGIVSYFIDNDGEKMYVHKQIPPSDNTVPDYLKNTELYYIASRNGKLYFGTTENFNDLYNDSTAKNIINQNIVFNLSSQYLGGNNYSIQHDSFLYKPDYMLQVKKPPNFN